ncbi:MAG TPA: hypothetical protein VM101_13520 [Flavitalea sp.]|nr:hypothetical protein [Flavitalea sp.]
MSNEYLIIQPAVKLTQTIIPVIEAFDAFFKEAGIKAFVTSGERTSEDQLNVIRMYSKRYEVDKEFPEILTCGVADKIDFGTTKIYTWSRAWSRLLNKGIIVNPPRPEKVLFDYIRDGVNKKGQEIGYSPHFFGRSFDIGGGVDHDITNELKVVEKAFKAKVRGFKGYLPERNNNAIHIDCE